MAAPGAQSELPVPERVINLWVDPIYGSDDPNLGAPAFNPLGFFPCTTSDLKPTHVQDPNQGGAVLLHASSPFKTINGPTGALSYIPPLPYHQGAIVWRYAIIHLLPGVYARYTAAHPDNGLKGNGETFPIYLPPGVSIQGTSALNTVFDLAEFNAQLAYSQGTGPAFHFGVVRNGQPINGQGTFIDSVSIYNALKLDRNRADDISGIYIGPDLNTPALLPSTSASPTITNCLFFRNQIGVCIAADRQLTPSLRHDNTALFNNTFALNWLGLYNGELPYGIAGLPATGVSRLVLVNNLFDFYHPSPTTCSYPSSWMLFPRSGFYDFEGVDVDDTTIAGPTGGNFNAFHDWRTPGVFPTSNVGDGVGGSAVPGMLPVTSSRTGRPVLPAVDISPFTGGLGPTAPDRGILYIRDLFCNMSATGSLGLPAGPPNSFFDLSPMDFRLCPTAAFTATPPQAPGLPGAGTLNPLIDAGWSGPFPLTMTSAPGQQPAATMARPPGFLVLEPGSQNTWPYDSFDYDCEGYGNRRIVGYVNPAVAKIDIGADEAGELLLAGYRNGTTTFLSTQDSSRLPVTFSGVPDNRFLWYIGPVLTTTVYTARPDYREYWWTPPLGLLTPPAYLSATNQFGPWYDFWSFTPAQPYYQPRRIEIMPHLLPDIHPWWTLGPVPWGPTNTIWQYCAGTSLYNPFLYQNPLSSVIHAPGSYQGYVGLGKTYQWIDGLAAVNALQFPPLPAFGGPTTINSFDSWCRGVTSVPGAHFATLGDTFTGTAPIVAVRLSVETQRGTRSDQTTATNLQSFSVVVEGQ